MDSGTSFSYLPNGVFNSVTKHIKEYCSSSSDHCVGVGASRSCCCVVSTCVFGPYAMPWLCVCVRACVWVCGMAHACTCLPHQHGGDVPHSYFRARRVHLL